MPCVCTQELTPSFGLRQHSPTKWLSYSRNHHTACVVDPLPPEALRSHGTVCQLCGRHDTVNERKKYWSFTQAPEKSCTYSWQCASQSLELNTDLHSLVALSPGALTMLLWRESFCSMASASNTVASSSNSSNFVTSI